jgi:aspartyl/asparaginyl beta-hydroxylase (cupin superfamily)
LQPRDDEDDIRDNCPATFTIAGQQKRWTESGALLFDDSYEHEVWNGCTESRGVLQLVITHPALLQRAL